MTQALCDELGGEFVYLSLKAQGNNGLSACRMRDTIQETTSINTIAMGEFTVSIGG